MLLRIPRGMNLRVMRINRDDLTREAMVQQIVLLNRDELDKYWVF